MLVPAMSIQFVVTVETLSTESTFGVTLESTLVYCSRVIIAELFMLAKLLLSKQLMLMRKDLLVPRAEVAHDLLMRASDMPMEIWPAPAGSITCLVGTVVT